MGLFFDNSAYRYVSPVLRDVQVGEGADGGVVDEHGGSLMHADSFGN